MAPPHRCVALTAAVAAAALLLTLDAAVASAMLRSPPGTVTDGVSEKSLDLGTVPLTMSVAEWRNTLKVLQAFAAAMPSLGWSGDDFCSWSGVRCTDANVGFVVSNSRLSGTLPEMPDDVDYSMVKLSEISIFGQRSGVTGTLPSSWSKLRKLRKVNLAYVGIRGTLPAAWRSMEAMEQIVIANTKITGTLPKAWSALPNLRRIHFQRCSLYGSLPESWARMPSLERLDLRKNKFCGCVPQLWLTSRTLSVEVDSRHQLPHCQRGKGCDETTTPERIGSRVSSSTLPPLSEHRCAVPKCIACVPRNSKLCGVCMEGYVRSDDWQCMKGPEWEAVPLAMTEAEWRNTLKVLQAFAAAMPSLGWSGGHFCSWSGVRCTDGNVDFVASNSWIGGTLPEMPDDVDYSMVKLDEISIFGHEGAVVGRLPQSWGKLRKLRRIRLMCVGISGTLPALWSSMTSIEQIQIWSTKITGTLPNAWSTMRKLRLVYLHDCNLYGSLPGSWARMPSLERLDLHNNKFCGCVPESWLTSFTLLMGVDTKHLMGNCSTAQACVEGIAEPARDPWSSDTRADLTTAPTTTTTTTTTTTGVPSKTSARECHVPHCVSCVCRDPMRCSECSSGYRLTADRWCVRRPAGDSTVLPQGTATAAVVSAILS